MGNDRSTVTYAALSGAFTPDELDAIEAYGDRLTQDRADILGSDELQQGVHEKFRVTRTAWILPNAETNWLFQRIQAVACDLNDNSYQFDLRGFAENLQYTVYHGDESGHYDWHVDQGPLPAPRKLSLSLQLSDASAYQVCDLQFQAGIVLKPRRALAAPSSHFRLTSCTG
ncbi:MAG: hypothetical protein JWP16_1030 [Alphaproteobacteria bacterium]|nr:hypothetical protein [Alphaproteobacteria bacterium]